MDAKQQLLELTRGAVDVHVEKDLLARLETGRPLRVKAGFDPTRPDLHLGHTVLMNKMRQFQEFGHEVIFVVGDFTAQIGDPSGKKATRPVPTREEIVEGARTYAEQAFQILDKDKTTLVYNSEWLSKMGFDDVIRLAGTYRLARMMERDDFKKRWAEHESISMHELLYPLAQAYDSVALKADVELGGTDQLFNLMVGREIMPKHDLAPQIVLTVPILEGLSAKEVDGKIVGDKMSKSLDNYVGIAEPAASQFGKLMSISDALMWRYYELLSSISVEDIASRKAACDGGENPKGAKVALAKEIVTRFHSSSAADAAHEKWEAQFSRKEVPSDLREVTIELEGDAEDIWIPKALAQVEAVPSSSQGRRLLTQGGIEVNGNKERDPKATLKKGSRYVIKAGKRTWLAITVK